MTVPQQPCPTDRSDAEDVEQHACPKCDAQPGSPCRSRGGAVASAYHTRRFTLVPRLKRPCSRIATANGHVALRDARGLAGVRDGGTAVGGSGHPASLSVYRTTGRSRPARVVSQ
ncbi:zinc finger domain-containing protein [Streptomyces cinereospinus]|uniref:zinc finger domain-containing protein n=1 Tax=Streptomyces cinereospinus TaxID=285561 RepID=UPI00406BBAD1